MVDLTQIFEREFAKPPSAIEAQASVAALGDEYPAGLDTYSWVSRTELRQVAEQVPVTDSRVIVDLGCGRGGPGLWVAGTTGTRLIGVDIAESALERARRLAGHLGVVDVEFRVGSFEATGLSDAAADLVMSFDAFLFTPDKQAAFVELARVLRPGGRVAMTSWDYHSQPRNRPPQIADHRPLAENAGFTCSDTRRPRTGDKGALSSQSSCSSAPRNWQPRMLFRCRRCAPRSATCGTASNA